MAHVVETRWIAANQPLVLTSVANNLRSTLRVVSIQPSEDLVMAEAVSLLDRHAGRAKCPKLLIVVLSSI